jgi:ferric-dicitrate binding protein FerR (iron transport regulator)
LLTTPGGKVIDLDSNAANTVLLQGGARLVKNALGEWIYRSGGNAAAGDGSAAGGHDHAVGGADRGGDDNATVYNTISAPRGGQFSFVLEDGTRVWLNAGSSIRFPTNFSGDRREVEMTGEAYFEVAHQDKLPFIVHAGERQIEDIGTHFNVNAYPDEPEMKTTLIEGSVKIGNVVLRPGEQLGLDSIGRERLVSHADIEEAMAWKNGLFVFNGADIETVMRSIERWYDVSIVYEAGKDSHRFTGQISRTSKASEALEILATSGYHFKIQGKIITVLP